MRPWVGHTLCKFLSLNYFLVKKKNSFLELQVLSPPPNQPPKSVLGQSIPLRYCLLTAGSFHAIKNKVIIDRTDSREIDFSTTSPFIFIGSKFGQLNFDPSVASFGCCTYQEQHKFRYFESPAGSAVYTERRIDYV